MKIAVNTRFLIKDKLEGLGWFTFEILEKIVRSHPEHEFVFLFDRTFDESFLFSKNVKGVKISPPARHPFLWYWWFEKSLPAFFKKNKIDAFISPDSFMSLKANVPTLLIVHDLAFEHYPEDVDKLVKRYYKRFMPRYCDKANRIVTVSEYTKQDVVKQYGISEGKIDVAHNGVRQKFSPIDVALKKDVQNKWSEGCPYLVYVGSIHPRKNIKRLFQAFEVFKEATGSNWKLVIVGRKAWQSKDIFEAYEGMKHKNEVCFTGRLSDHDLNNVVAGAEALTYVPYFEGFGLPIVEAQQCDVPVITSNVTSMPEVAGDSCLLVDPFSVSSISEGMKKMYADNTFRQEMIEKGKVNRERFKWENTAQQVWDSLMQMINA